MSRIDYSSSVIRIPKKNITCPSGKSKTEFTSPIAKSTSPGLSDNTFLAHCAKYEFYENLASTISTIPSWEQQVLLDDFNARVGADNDSWHASLGPFGVGKTNENGQRLLELCAFHNLCITNSFLKTKLQHKVSRRHQL